jgi:hypothetical protein
VRGSCPDTDIVVLYPCTYSRTRACRSTSYTVSSPGQGAPLQEGQGCRSPVEQHAAAPDFQCTSPTASPGDMPHSHAQPHRGVGKRSLWRQAPGVVIPQDAGVYGVDGACLTGPTQIKWIGQLLERDYMFAFHIDGKYKLHHGQWILCTLGTHMLTVRGAKLVTLSTTFIPLVYLFAKQHESDGAG